VSGFVYNLNHRQIEMTGESKIAAVVSRNSHYSASSVAHQHVIGNPYRYQFAGKRVYGISAGEFTAYFFYFRHPFALGAVFSPGNINIYLFTVLGSCDF